MKKIIAGTAIGILAGAATTLLVAPKAGKEVRSDIKSKAGSIKESAARRMEGFDVVSLFKAKTDEEKFEVVNEEVSEEVVEAAEEKQTAATK